MNDVSPKQAKPSHSSTVTEEDLGKALQESALLASVTISVWDATVTDKKLLQDLKTQHGAQGDVGRLIKNIYAGADEPLKAVKSAFNSVRTRHYELTMPWVSNPHADRRTGPRLLPHPLFQRYLIEIGKLRTQAMTELDNFLPQLPDMEKRARANLGSMADLHYPTQEEVKARFHIHMDFEPIPDGTAFRGLPDGWIGRLSHHLNQRQQNQVTEVSAAMWREVRENVEHLMNRLVGEDTKFKEASIRNVKDLVGLLPGWNIRGDKRIDEIVEDIKDMLEGIEASDLRKDPKMRAATAADAKKITDKLTSWGL